MWHNVNHVNLFRNFLLYQYRKQSQTTFKEMKEVN